MAVMKCFRLLALSAASIIASLVLFLGGAPGKRSVHAESAQIAGSGPTQNALISPDAGAKLAFSDGDVLELHAIGSGHAITYRLSAAVSNGSSAGGSIRVLVDRVINLEPDTAVLSISADGRKAIIATGSSLLMLNTVTGQRQDIPPGWYGSGENSDAALSGDGRLVSIFSESGTIITIAVYDWPAKALVAKRKGSPSVGGIDSGGVTADGAVEFVNNRGGRKVVNLKTGDLIGWFGSDSIRSPDGEWAVEFPDLSFNDSAPKSVLIKSGTSGKTIGKLRTLVPENELYGQMTGVFCGGTGRFVAAGGHGIAAYAIPSGVQIAYFPAASWRDANAGDTDPVSIACSPSGTLLAILSGTRLTVHNLTLPGVIATTSVPRSVRAPKLQ